MIVRQDALERAYQRDIAGQRAEASKLYRLGIDTIYEGLQLKVPGSWLTGSNVSKWRSNLNGWLQGATDRQAVLHLVTAAAFCLSIVSLLSPSVNDALKQVLV